MAPENQTIPPIRCAGEFAVHSRRLDSHRCRSWSTFDTRSSERGLMKIALLWAMMQF